MDMGPLGAGRTVLAAARGAGRELVVVGKRRSVARAPAGVTYAGALDVLALAALYRTSAALLHPTFHDPFSIACLEALASGCPVITTRRPTGSYSIAWYARACGDVAGVSSAQFVPSNSHVSLNVLLDDASFQSPPKSTIRARSAS